MKRLSTRERKKLRRIHGSVVEQGIWKKRTDQELYRDPDIVADIKKKRLECIGQVLRM
jgi:G:T-mismatch repair DNA endonuclease (very short patch repair protein)